MFGAYRLSFLAAVFLSVFQASPGWAVTCGDTITSDTKLDPALDFPSQCTGLPAALTIVGPAKVDMNGVVIGCSDPFVAIPSTGINIVGDGVLLENGGVENCTGGIVVAGDGNQLRDVYVTAKTFGIHGLPALAISITGDKNTVRGTSARVQADAPISAGSKALSIEGDKNRVQDCVVDVTRDSDLSATGIWVGSGANNRISDNVVGMHYSSGGVGINVRPATAGTAVTGNTATCRSGTGFVVGGTGSKVVKNRSACSFAFIVGGTDAKWVRNVAMSACTGFWIEPDSGLTFKRNTSLGNRPDDVNCGDVVWAEDFDCTTAKIEKNLLSSLFDDGAINCP